MFPSILFSVKSLIYFSLINRLEAFVKSYKVKEHHPKASPESVEHTVRDIMDELLQVIMKNISNNPTIPDGDSQVPTPSTL